MELNEMLAILAKQDGSDLYLSTGAAPSAKFQGVLKVIEERIMQPGETLQIARSILDAEQQKTFEQELEMNLAISIPGTGRFRVNIFWQRNEVSIVARNIKTDIPRFEDLKLPDVLLDTVMEKRGLVLFVGGTGSGKSTSLAALIDHRNRNSSGHIITIEDPVEYVHQHRQCIINQREVGVDTRSFHAALKNTLRQAPDVILIGEIRDRETMEHALAFSETGHLAISTLHANNANQALDRIINFFPEERRPQLLNDLGNNLKSFISQRLVPTVDGKRRAAVEVLMGTRTIQDMIKRGEFDGIKEIMEKSKTLGMQTFDMDLFELYLDGVISEEEALKNSDSPTNLKLKIKLHKEGRSNQTETSSEGEEKAQQEEKASKLKWSLEPQKEDDDSGFY